MSLFQKSVEKKYLNELDSVLIDRKYKEFRDYFGNPSIQQNIRNSKEEQFQEGFLRELFVSIFGYTLNPQPDFNLTTELKNIANSKKADGAILKGEDAIAVIELKGTDTSDLDKIETQAFGYKNHHPKCIYVITSNFEKLRFYIQNAVDHIDFDLFKLTREQFSLMWLCLAKENLLKGLAQKIKELSLLQEENITKKLYTEAYGGVQFIKSYGGGSTTKPYYKASLIGDLDENTVASLSYINETSIVSYSRNNFARWRVSTDISRKLAQRLWGSASAFYGEGEYEAVDITNNFAGISAGFTYDVSKDIKVSINYTYSNNDSNDISDDYTKNVYKIGIRGTF